MQRCSGLAVLGMDGMGFFLMIDDLSDLGGRGSTSLDTPVYVFAILGAMHLDYGSQTTAVGRHICLGKFGLVALRPGEEQRPYGWVVRRVLWQCAGP